MELEAEEVKIFTLYLDDDEARDLTTDLFNLKMGYRALGITETTNELLQWLGSRNEDVPSGS